MTLILASEVIVRPLSNAACILCNFSVGGPIASSFIIKLIVVRCLGSVNASCDFCLALDRCFISSSNTIEFVVKPHDGPSLCFAVVHLHFPMGMPYNMLHQWPRPPGVAYEI